MKLGWTRTIAGATATLVVCLLGAATVSGQAVADKPQMSETFFKNVQVLKDIPVDEFMDAMGMFAASLGYDCASCHSAALYNDRDAFAVTTPAITRARQMMAMVNTINKNFFKGEPRVTCFTCHHANNQPQNVPSLVLQYAELMDDPSAMTIFPDRGTTVDAVFAKYMQALGGTQRVAGLTSFVARGTYEGFNTGHGEVPTEIFAKAPGQRTTVVHMPDGEAIKVYDGRTAWAAEGWRPMPLLTLTGGNLSGARVDAIVNFPATLRNAFSEWKVGSATIDDKPVQILQGTNPGELPVNFYFDESGLLVRSVRWNKTAVGTVPTQVDYSNYKDVAGVKVPHHLLMTWTDGQNTFNLSEVRANVAIEASRFAKPAPYTRK